MFVLSIGSSERLQYTTGSVGGDVDFSALFATFYSSYYPKNVKCERVPRSKSLMNGVNGAKWRGLILELPLVSDQPREGSRALNEGGAVKTAGDIISPLNL